MPRTVADLCVSKGVSLEQLADRAGLDVGRTQAILMARWTPGPTERQRIAAVFGVSVEEIVWGHATPIQHLYGHGPG
jgi:transcriptional regulator with XRE-family HTH domain